MGDPGGHAAVDGFENQGPGAAAEALLAAVRLAWQAHESLVGHYARALAGTDEAADAGVRAYTLPVHDLATALADLRRFIDYDPAYDHDAAERMVADIADRLRAVLPREGDIITGRR